MAANNTLSTRKPAPNAEGAPSKADALSDELAASPSVFRTKDVARLSGLHASTIRRLDARGLLHPARTWAGHRRYTQADLIRIRALAGLPE